MKPGTPPPQRPSRVPHAGYPDCPDRLESHATSERAELVYNMRVFVFIIAAGLVLGGAAGHLYYRGHLQPFQDVISGEK